MAASSGPRLVPVSAAIVVDASALAAVVFGEPEAEGIAARLEGARLLAPALLFYELGNVCLKKMRRHPKQRDDLAAALALSTRLGIEIVDVDHVDVLRLAERHMLSVYDAAYFWLAKRLDADLVTLDRQLMKAR
jgi:predicted nucleic acid-binding protein